jgi:2-C-methyl-D-erythritol 4-phosphate cytidylyltransferase
VPDEATVVLVHDGARPLASVELYRRVIDAVAGGADVVVPVVAVVDTIRSVDGGVVDRDQLRAVQTPQGFRAAVVRAAHAEAAEATDDAALAEALGATVTLVEGETTNLKITRPVDLVVARSYLEDSDDA